MHYALTDSVEEWGDALLTLDHAVIEGFSLKGLKGLLRDAQSEFEESWQSLRLLERLLNPSKDGSDTEEILKPLKELHNLRNKVKGHKAGSDRNKLVTDARLAHGDLQNHFRKLVGQVHSSLEYISEALE